MHGSPYCKPKYSHFLVKAKNNSWLTSCTHRKAQEVQGWGDEEMCLCDHVGLLFSDLFFDAASWCVNHVVKPSI